MAKTSEATPSNDKSASGKAKGKQADGQKLSAAPAKEKAKKNQAKEKNLKAEPSAAAKAVKKSSKKNLVWEALNCEFKAGKSDDGFRAKVPGGWFVSVARNKGGGSFFYPDALHKWDGNSL